LEPESLKEACTLLSKHKEEAKLIAGGQSLVPLLKGRYIVPDYVISIKNLHELEYIREEGNCLRIGALTVHRAIETSPIIKDKLPVLVDAERWLAQLQIRNWGTIGGGLSHADPAGDMAPPLIALGAKVIAASTRGERTIPLEEFFVNIFTTVLESDEILKEVEVPFLPPDSGIAYRKETVIAGDYPIVSVAAAIYLDAQRETVKDARIVLGAVGMTPIMAGEAGQAITGKKANGKLAEEAGVLASREADPTVYVLGSVEYKREMAGVLTTEIVGLAIERAQQQKQRGGNVR
jgi:carbon-monoxide dehydrogenase medium subunit